ncbi:MAG: hypothetical protein HY329_05445 [Chloroflexi bacterium]|nr:hypothetical protein [Chloroflexota bacterium]
MPPLFEAVRSRYNYVFVDVGRTLSRISMPVLIGADYIIVVLGADPATVKLARACLEFFTAAGITSRRLILGLSRAVGRAGLTRDELSNRLGLPVPVTIPHDPDRFDAALAGGLPLTVREPQASSAASFEEIIRLFTRAVAS